MSNFKKIIFAAAFLGNIIPFGGRILQIIPSPLCLIVVVGPPKPGTFAIIPTTRIYAHYTLNVNTWVLGIAAPLGSPLCPPPIIMLGTGR